MRDYDGMVKQLTWAMRHQLCANCALDQQCEGMCVFGKAADAIEELLTECEKYRHAAFVISETCVEESKCHISTDDAIQKIREYIYYSGQITLPEPPKEDNA